MYNFVLIQWRLGKFAETQAQNAVTKGFISQEQVNTILAMPQI